MSLNKYRNQPCPCGSKKKFKHCCLQNHYDAQAGVVTPIQRQEKAKDQVWYKKQYDRVTGAKQNESDDRINTNKSVA